MDKHAARMDRNAELMGDDIVGIFLSEEVLSSSSKTKTRGDKLRRFVHHQESIQCLHPLGSGIHGAVLLAAIKNVKYALKVVRMGYYTQYHLSNMSRSSNIGNNLVPSSIHMRKQSIPLHLRKKAEDSLDFTQVKKTEHGRLGVMGG